MCGREEILSLFHPLLVFSLKVTSTYSSPSLASGVSFLDMAWPRPTYQSAWYKRWCMILGGQLGIRLLHWSFTRLLGVLGRFLHIQIREMVSFSHLVWSCAFFLTIFWTFFWPFFCFLSALSEDWLKYSLESLLESLDSHSPGSLAIRTRGVLVTRSVLITGGLHLTGGVWSPCRNLSFFFGFLVWVLGRKFSACHLVFLEADAGRPTPPQPAPWELWECLLQTERVQARWLKPAPDTGVKIFLQQLLMVYFMTEEDPLKIWSFY